MAIFDPDFQSGERARFLYGPEDEAVIVKVLDKEIIEGEEWYIVCAHKNIIKMIGLHPSEFYSQYFEDQLLNEQAFIVEPDELEYCYRNLKLLKMENVIKKGEKKWLKC